MDKKNTWPLGMLEIRQSTEAQAAIWRLARPKARSASISLCTARKASTIRQPRRTAEGKKVNHLPTNAPKNPTTKNGRFSASNNKTTFLFLVENLVEEIFRWSLWLGATLKATSSSVMPSTWISTTNAINTSACCGAAFCYASLGHHCYRNCLGQTIRLHVPLGRSNP